MYPKKLWAQFFAASNECLYYFKDSIKYEIINWDHNLSSYVSIGLLYDPETNTTHPSNETSMLSYTFVSPSLMIKWTQCCADARQCCLESLGFSRENLKPMKQMCPRTWDGWSCWQNEAKPSTVQELSCPKHIYWHQSVPPCRGK